MVSSVDGKITTLADNAEGLGSRTDRLLMQRLRIASDAVLIGASTFRRDPFVPDVKPEFAAERANFFPQQPHPLAMVLSSDGNLPLESKFFQAERNRRVIFLGPQASTATVYHLNTYAQVFQLEAMPFTESGTDRQADLGQLLRIAFDELGIRKLLVEGGPTLNYAFISQHWADELFWTLAPKIVGGNANLSLVEGPGKGFGLAQLPLLQLLSIYEQSNELFMRYKFLV
jgi:riboflavin-specific deaminase-like protein